MYINDIFSAVDAGENIQGVTIMSADEAGMRYFAALQSMRDTLSRQITQWHDSEIGGGYVLQSDTDAWRKWKFITIQPYREIERALMFVKSKRANHWSLIEVEPSDFDGIRKSVQVALLFKSVDEKTDMSNRGVHFEHYHVRRSWQYSETAWMWKRGGETVIEIHSAGQQSWANFHDMKCVEELLLRLRWHDYVNDFEVPKSTEFDPEPPRDPEYTKELVPAGWIPARKSKNALAYLKEHFDE